ncbi:MAG: PIN domain-containing protein [Nanoarchaeota archaeon]
MEKQAYYVDTNIWLNLFKKEENLYTGRAYWKIAQDFLEKIMFSDDKEIIYSGLILKELMYKLTRKEFREKELFMKREPRCRFVILVSGDYTFARKLEFEFGFEISFYDCLHITVCRRIGAILITRDNKLLQCAQRYIQAFKPEHLLP